MSFRDRCCKPGKGPCLLGLIIAILVFGACSRGRAVQFCEGVKPDGDGVNCGVKFETGELTALIKSSRPFGGKSIKLVVTEVGGKKTEKIETVVADVKPDRDRAAVPLSFYTDGTYRVTAMNGDETIGEGKIEIVDR